jgi:DNA-binding CsgD family transcriptional regulator
MELIGRNAERKQLAELIDGTHDRGGALLIRGEAGVGKSALLAKAVESATEVGLRVLATTGCEAEQHLPFAGLHQLVYPIRQGIDTLPAPQRTALATALGLADGTAQTAHLVGLALLTLLSDTAAERPLLVTADDAHWLDRSSAEVLAFAARRLESEPIAFVATLRDENGSPLRDAGLPSMLLEPLSEDTAGELLDVIAPALAPKLRSRILREAAGNPLALRELPLAVRDHDESDPIPPLTERLERTFGVRLADLPARTRSTLLVAAIDDGDSVPEILAAASRLVGEALDSVTLAPAIEAGLIEVRSDSLRFRHPLMRSAVVAASPDARRGAQRALADTLTGQPDRVTWHLAAATAEPNEDVAAALALVADDAQRRGGVHSAITALEQAARLSAAPGRRAERLLRAGELAAEAGRRDLAERLLTEVRRCALSPRQEATATWLVSAFDDGIRDGSGAVALARLAQSVAHGPESGSPAGLSIRILWGAAMRCFWIEPGAHARREMLAIADELLTNRHDPRLVAISAYLAPFERGDEALNGLHELAATIGIDPQTDRFLGSAAMQIGAFDLASKYSGAAATGFRAQGRLGLLTRALAVQAYSRVRLGDLSTAAPAAAEASLLAQETEQPYLDGLAKAVQAQIAALHGHYRQATALAAEAERIGLAAAARPVLATTQHARALAALGEGRYADAFTDLRRMFDPADPAYQIALRCYVLPELADAALRSGHVDELRQILAELEDLAATSPSPALHTGLRYARAILASRDHTDHAEALFQSALDADLTRWPLDLGRLRLAYGEWLRRQRRIAEARAQLRTARETFDALGVISWGERARHELRSAGETSPQRRPDARDQLTAHELGIAQLAAQGLTNREIGQRLYLSHRTVSTHLHRIFPKLGVTSRTELATALTPNQMPD